MLIRPLPALYPSRRRRRQLFDHVQAQGLGDGKQVEQVALGVGEFADVIEHDLAESRRRSRMPLPPPRNPPRLPRHVPASIASKISSRRYKTLPVAIAHSRSRVARLHVAVENGADQSHGTRPREIGCSSSRGKHVVRGTTW